MKLSPPWRYYSKFYKGSYPLLLGGSIISAGQTLLLVPILWLVRRVFDEVVPQHQYGTLAWIGVAIVGLYFANAVLVLWVRHITLQITKRAIQRLRTELLNKLYRLSRLYYSQADTGWLHALMVQDTLRLDMMSNALIAQVIPMVIICSTFSILLIRLNWVLFLVAASIGPLIYLSASLLGKQVKREVGKNHKAFAAFSQGIWFVLQMMDLTHIQGAEKTEISRQTQLLNTERTVSGRMALFNEAFSVSQDLILVISFALFLVAGGIAVGQGYMSPGEAFSFIVALALLKNQFYRLLKVIPQVIEGSESLKEIYQLVKIPDVTPYLGQTAHGFKGKITLKNVSFSYEDRFVLQNVSFEVNPGQIVAIVGKNGAGKSTIISLVLGFYHPQSGELYADEEPFDSLDMVTLRQQIGVVMQDNAIFAGTVWDNLTYGFPDLSSEVVQAAAHLATAHEFIEQLPKGYHTLIGERGMLLSGGQRQRLAIARALLNEPKLLILDEPTNHLDALTVANFIQNLKNLPHGPAILLISHHEDIIGVADKIYILQESRLTPQHLPSSHRSKELR